MRDQAHRPELCPLRLFFVTVLQSQSRDYIAVVITVNLPSVAAC